MTLDGTGPVLDLERLDAAADDALEGVRIDLSAVRARAAAEHRRTGRVRWALVAAAAAVLLVAAAAVSGAGVLRSAPQPAAVPPGPGALPERIYAVPRLVTPVDRAPISRVAAVLQTALSRPVGWHGENATSVVLVGADGGQYRRLPGPLQVSAVSVSGDGRVVAWTEGLSGVVDPTGPRTGEVRWVEVATGRTARTGFGYPADRRPAVEATWLSPDGSELVVQTSSLLDRSSQTARTLDLWFVDTALGHPALVCRACTGNVAWDGTNRMLAEGFRAESVDGVLPPVGTVEAGYAVGPMSHNVFVSADGTRGLAVVSNAPGSGSAEPAYLVEIDGRGRTVSKTPLGLTRGASVLAWSDRTAWLSVAPDADGSPTDVRRLTVGRSPVQVVLRHAGRVGPASPVVVGITADVAAGGLTAATPPPAGEPWWSAESLHLFLVQNLVALGLVVLLVAVPFAGRWARRRGGPRWLVQPAPWDRPAVPPSRLDREAQAAGRDFFFGALDRRARPTRREDVERVFDDDPPSGPGGRAGTGTGDGGSSTGRCDGTDGGTDGAEGSPR